MSFQPSFPPSAIRKMAAQELAEGGEEEVPKKQSREDFKKLKELEEMRKAGTAPAMKDEEGRDINPHIPQYIMQAPWYYGSMTPTLNHQRLDDETTKKYSDMSHWFKKGVMEGPVATKFRKGACENCGAMTHKKMDCLERPRKVGARFTGQGIAPDEYIQPELAFDFEGKRDRWNGYDPNEHKKVIEDYAKLEEAKRQLKAAGLEAEEQKDAAKQKKKGDDDEDDEDLRYADDVDMPGQKFETKQRITVRNLRIREDTAKYLYNLDPNSAYYDPKTRSMRENPFKQTGKHPSDLHYAGDNFVRVSGDAHMMAKGQMFAWDAYEHGSDVHLQADPTKLELLGREFNKRKDDFKTDIKQNILDRYGGQEHLEAPPKQLLMAQTEEYVEYSRHGTVIKGQEKAKVKSQYQEDVYINNHASVWGSYWKEGRWGFHCCHSFIKESYCTGEAGRNATQAEMPALLEAEAQRATEELSQTPDEPKKGEGVQVTEKKKKKRRGGTSHGKEKEEEKEEAPSQEEEETLQQ